MNINSQIFKFLASDEDFMTNYYLPNYIDRFVYTTADIEEITKEEERMALVKEMVVALKLGLSSGSKITPYDIIDIGNLVNKNAGYEGIRKINVSAGKYATFIPSVPSQIRSKLYDACNNYQNIWNILDPYLREAYFHINLMHIHPFEDGNKRTTKILLASNLIKNNCAPIIINSNEIPLYYKYLNEEYTYDEFAMFIKEHSDSELQNMISLYKTLNKIPPEKSIEEFIPKERSL